MTEEPRNASGGQPEDPQRQADSAAQGDPGDATPADGVTTPSEQQSSAHPGYGQPTGYERLAGDQQAHSTAEQPAQPYAGQQTPHWQPGGYYPMNPVPVPQQRQSGSGKVVAGVAAVAIVTALLGGGVGGYIGYELGNTNSSGPTALDQAKPARSVSTAPAGTVQQVAQKVLPSVVQLQVQSPQGSGEGSGVVLSSDGYILTNNHVAEGASQGEMNALFHDNRSAPVRVIGKDPNSDLAVVKADITGLVPAERGRSDDLPVGAPVVAIGSPFGLSGTVTSGIISAKDRPVRAGGEQGAQSSVLNALQTDAAINPGNSGGPLVDMDGRVVGINSAIYSPGSGQEQAGSVGLGFAIPVDQAWRTAQELKQTGAAQQTTLGVSIKPSIDPPGAVVAQVVPGGAAEAAGIRTGEVVTRFDGRVVRDADTLVAAVRSHVPGDRVQVTLSQPGGGAERTVDVTLVGQKVGG
jgi:putative serine protease PepD